MENLLRVMRTLRGPDGCPWDRRQTHASLRPYLLEEAAEAVEVLGSDDPHEAVDELGDVLLQIAFHAVIAEEAGSYGYPEIEAAVVAKLIRRHPHVFGSTEVADEAEVVRNWETIKAAERVSPRDPVASLPRALPTLMRIAELDRLLVWEVDESVAGASLSDLGNSREQLGQALLTLVQLARRAGIEPEMALRDAAAARQQEEDRSP